jgi:predicted nucleic acid-binding Zn ribbon protein
MNDLLPLASILPALFRKLGLAETAEGWRAVAEWPVVAGARIARHTHAESFRNGALIVEVEGSAWMQELGFLKPELLRNLNQHLGANVVRDVRFTPAGARPRDAGTRPKDGHGDLPR